MTRQADTEAERLLRQVVNEWDTSYLHDMSGFRQAILEAGWYIREKDRCEYHCYEGEGPRCLSGGVRLAGSMWCCDEHAKRREDWLK